MVDFFMVNVGIIYQSSHGCYGNKNPKGNLRNQCEDGNSLLLKPVRYLSHLRP